MKRLLALLLLIFLAACAAQPGTLDERGQAPPAEPAVIVEPAAEPEPAVTVEPGPAMPEDDLAERLAKEQEEKILESLETVPKVETRERTTIAEQMYQTYLNLDSHKFNTPEGLWMVRGDKAKLVPRTAIRLINVKAGEKTYRDVYIDEIIFDRDDKTAVGYCAGFDEDVNMQCAHFELYDIQFQLTYSTYMRKLSDDWLKEYLTKTPSNEEYEKYYIDNVETVRVHYPDNVEMYFNPRAGLPTLVVFGQLDRTKYDDLVINQVRPEDVIHRSKKDIPPEEQFKSTIY